MKKLTSFITFVSVLITLSTFASFASTVKAADETVKVAVVGDQTKEIWEFVATKAKKEKINIEVITMADYVQPNKALQDGSVDMNSFQHRAYLEQWNTDQQSDLKEIGTTFIVPLYYFSEKYASLSELPDNAKVAIPQEVAIQGRALLALQKAGVLELKDGGSTKSSVKDIEKNPKNIELIEIESSQAPRILPDVDAVSINGSMASEAGINIDDNIFTDADYLDLIPKDRYNIIVVRSEDVENPTYKKIVELFQSDDVAKKMNEIAPGQFFPVWDEE